MSTKPTKENTLYLPIKQVYFDAIIAGTKKQEYREIKDTTYKKYLDCDDKGYPYIDESIPEDAPSDIMMYNNGHYPFYPKPYAFLHLAVGYNSNRDSAIIKIDDITFEVIRDMHGEEIHLFWNPEKEDFVRDPQGDLCPWQVVYHLGEVVSYTPKQ